MKIKVLVTNIHPKFPIARMGRSFKKGESVELELRPKQIKALQRNRYLKVEIVYVDLEDIDELGNTAKSKGRGWYEYNGKNVRKKDLPDGTIIEEKKEE